MATQPDVELLDETFLAVQRARLEAEREEATRHIETLLEEINGLARQHEATGAEEGFGRVDLASVDLERARSQHAKATAQRAQVEAALARIDAGAYGRCVDCGGPIGRGRLEAMPEAARCITCQARATPPGRGPR